MRLSFRRAALHRMRRRHLAKVTGEDLLDSITERRLVSLDVENVVAATSDDLSGDLGLAAHGVDGHDRPLVNQYFQQFRNGGDLVALFIRDHLAKADRVGRRPGTHHMDRGLAACCVEATQQPLAVDRDHLPLRHLVQRGEPAQQAPLKLRSLDGCKDRIEPVVRRDSIRETEQPCEPRLPRTSKVGDCHEIIRTADDGADRDHDEVDEGMRNFWAPRISQGREVHLKLRGKQLGNWHDDVVRDSATFGCRDGTQRLSVAQLCQTTHRRAIALGPVIIIAGGCFPPAAQVAEIWRCENEARRGDLFQHFDNATCIMLRQVFDSLACHLDILFTDTRVRPAMLPPVPIAFRRFANPTV